MDVQEDADRGVSNEVEASAGVDPAVSCVEGGDHQEGSDGVLAHSFLRLWEENRDIQCYFKGQKSLDNKTQHGKTNFVNYFKMFFHTLQS